MLAIFSMKVFFHRYNSGVVFAFFLLLGGLLWMPPGHAAATKAADNEQALQSRLATLEQQGKLSQQTLEEAQLAHYHRQSEVDKLRLEIDNLEAELNNADSLTAALEEEYRLLRRRPVMGEAQQALDNLWRNLQQQQQEMAQNQTTLEARRERLREAEEAAQGAQQWLEQVKNRLQSRNQQQQEEQSESLQQAYQDQVEALQTQLAKLAPQDITRRRELQWRLQELEARAQLAQDEFKLEGFAERFAEARLDYRQLQLEQQPTLESVDLLGVRLSTLLLQLDALSARLRARLEWLGEQRALLRIKLDGTHLAEESRQVYRGELDNLLTLLKLYQEPQQNTQELREQTDTLLLETRAWQERLQQAQLYSRRGHVPRTWEAWGQFFQDALRFVPSLLNQQYQALQQRLRADLSLLWESLLLLALAALLFLSSILKLRKLLFFRLARLAAHQGGGFSALSLYIGLRLLYLNFPLLALLGLIALLNWLEPLTWLLPMLFYFLLLVLALKLPLNLAWLLLAAPERRTPFDNQPLYRGLVWLFSLSFLFVALTWLVHLLAPLRDDALQRAFLLQLTELSDSLFMLFLALLVYPALQFWHMALERLHQHLGGYWFWIIKLLTLLLPLSLLVVGLLGLIGYLNLAWQMAGYLSLIFIVMSLWLLLERLLNDAVNSLKNYLMIHSRNSLLWTQDVIPVLHRLLRLGLLMLAVLLILYWKSSDIGLLEQVLRYPLFHFAGAQFQVGTLLLNIAVLMLVLWLGSWSRRLTYRWIYASISDLGIRHSLAVFTQYSVVLIGGLIALRMSGLDLTAITVFAGAVGVGLGFGLRNLASDYLSGLFLLIERPLRTGDWVNISGAEQSGEVTKIGMRALTVLTWDNEEVIIPNSTMMNAPFINWTHSDNILRTVIWVEISYKDDETQAQQILEDIIRQHEMIIKEMEHMALAWRFTERGVLFRVHYHTDLLHYDRLSVRSQIILTIRRRFREADITIPHSQQDLYLKEWPRGEMETAVLPPA